MSEPSTKRHRHNEDDDDVIIGGFDDVAADEKFDENASTGDIYWNFNITNTVESSRTVVVAPVWPPNCELEHMRGDIVYQLRLTFNNMVQGSLRIKAPNETFNRWIFDQLTSNRTNVSDQLLPDLDKELTTGVLVAQLVENMPCSTYVSWSMRRDARAIRRIIKQYVEACRKWMSTPPDDLVHLLHDLEDCESQKPRYTTYRFNHKSYNVFSAEEMLNMLEVVKDSFGQIIMPAAKTGVMDMVKKFIETAKSKISVLSSVERTSDVVQVNSSEKVYDIVYKNDRVSCTKMHYDKLRKLYRIHNTERDKSLSYFNDALFVLLRRYRTFFGTDIREGEGAAFHAAAPESVFTLLSSELAVTMEGFASPLNCYFSTFCSAFPDVDGLFGSQGSFFDFIPMSGSMEVGPPYTLEVMDRTADALIRHLDKSTLPLSFAVFVPEWRKPVAHYHTVMDNTKYCRWYYKAPGRQHAYVRGDQHTVRKDQRDDDERFFNLPFETACYFLQNDLGAAKYKITEEFKTKLIEALKVHVVQRQ